MSTPNDELAPKQIQWCRDTIPGFAAIHDQATKALEETEEYRKKFASHMVAQARREQ